MHNPFTLQNKTILVTGASSGIGRATAIECSKLGANVIVVARNEDRLKETIGLMEGENHEYRICDFSDIDSIPSLVDSLPIVDGVINNAGFTVTAPIQFIKESSFEEILKVNTIAPVLLVKYLLKKKKMKKGSIVFTSSMAGLGKNAIGNGMYAASKGGISAIVTELALELAPKGIRVNAVCPAMVETNVLSAGTISPEQLELDKLNYPLKRYGKPEEIAWAMIYFLSEASAWVTGTNMVIDGGISVK